MDSMAGVLGKGNDSCCNASEESCIILLYNGGHYYCVESFDVILMSIIHFYCNFGIQNVVLSSLSPI